MKESKITLFPDLKKPNDGHVKTLDSALRAIKDPNAKVKPKIERIRTTKDKELREELKKELPIICFGGIFTERRASSLVEYSKVICLDFDKVECLEDLETELKANEHVYALWKSPSGNGLKALVKVSTDNHLGHSLALLKDFPQADPAAIKDVNRGTFLSWDQDLYHNPDAKIYDRVILPKYADDQKYDNLRKWLENKGDQFVNGQRNSFITKLSAAANRFGINKEFLMMKMESDFLNGSDFTTREMTNTVNGIYQRYVNQHNTVVADEIWTDKKVEEVMRVDVKPRDVIYLKDVESDLIKDFNEGTQKAPTTYFPRVDEIFRPMRGDLNVMTGIGNYGKSAWGKQLDLIGAVKNGEKCCYFSPEEFPPIFWYRELVRSYIGKPIEKGDPYRMTEAEFRQGMDFVKTHFIYVYPPQLPTPEYLIERFAEAVIKHGIDRITLDPWNQLLHVMSKRDDIYLGETLSKFERFAQQHDIYLTIICHPNRTHKNDKTGNYDCPDVFDLNGGPVWNARATNLTVYHRPNYQTDKTDATFEFHSKKIKRQMLSGVPGEVSGTYDRRKGRFYLNGMNPLEHTKMAA